MEKRFSCWILFFLFLLSGQQALAMRKLLKLLNSRDRGSGRLNLSDMPDLPDSDEDYSPGDYCRKFRFVSYRSAETDGFSAPGNCHELEILCSHCSSEDLKKLATYINGCSPELLTVVVPVAESKGASIVFSNESRGTSPQDVTYGFYEFGKAIKDIPLLETVIFKFDWSGVDLPVGEYEVFYKGVMSWAMESFFAGLKGFEQPLTPGRSSVGFDPRRTMKIFLSTGLDVEKDD